MTRPLASLFAAACFTACATSGAPQRCPSPVASTVAAATVPLPTTEDDPLRARVPADSLVAVRLDVAALMRSEVLQLLWPIVIWHAALDPVRAACGEQLWDTVRELSLAVGPFEDARDPTGAALLAAGPIADPTGAACAAALMRLASSTPRTAASPSGTTFVLAGSPGALTHVEATVLGRSASMRESAPFAGMTPSLRDSHATLLVDLASLRERSPGVFQDREFPLAELSPQLLSARSLRVEVADASADRSLLRWTTHFATPVAAQQALDTQRALNERGLPSMVLRALEHEFADHPHRDQMLAAMSRAYTRLVESMLQPRVVGSDLVYESHFDAMSASAILGALAGAAAPAFTRYTHRSQATEATTNVPRIADAIVAHWNAQPRPRRRLIGAIPRTPPLAPSESPRADPAGTWDAVPWRALGFHLDAPHRYVYDVQSDGRTTFTARAQGDLDGDGTLSTYSITGHVGRDGTITLDPIHIENELE